MNIVEKLNSYYSARSVTERATRAYKIGPSNMGSCLREMAFLLNGLEPGPLRPEQARTFELGSQRGEALEKAAKAIWPDAQSQVPVRIPCGKHTLEGTCDLWIPSERTVVDFKTQATFGFGLLDSEGASIEYRLQVHAYRAGMTQGVMGWDVGAVRAVIVYEAKDSDARKQIKAQELKAIEVPWTEELEATYQKRLKEIALLLDLKGDGTLDPTLVAGLAMTNGKRHWKCREEGGKGLYCAVGPTQGRCFE